MILNVLSVLDLFKGTTVHEAEHKCMSHSQNFHITSENNASFSFTTKLFSVLRQSVTSNSNCEIAQGVCILSQGSTSHLYSVATFTDSQKCNCFVYTACLKDDGSEATSAFLPPSKAKCIIYVFFILFFISAPILHPDLKRLPPNQSI